MFADLPRLSRIYCPVLGDGAKRMLTEEVHPYLLIWKGETITRVIKNHGIYRRILWRITWHGFKEQNDFPDIKCILFFSTHVLKETKVAFFKTCVYVTLGYFPFSLITLGLGLIKAWRPINYGTLWNFITPQ